MYIWRIVIIAETWHEAYLFREGLEARVRRDCRDGLKDRSERVEEGSYAILRASCQTRSTSLPATPSLIPLRASFLSFSDRIPSLGLFIRRGAERETFASARQTCAKLRCRNSSMERNMVGTAEAL